MFQKHHFLPEAFTHDLQVHWAQYPLRPEFIESTYLLYRATKDIHYLQVAKDVMESLDKYVRVNCGFAGVKDIRTMSHEDRMDSFVLSETFKYLYMIFAEPSDLPLDPDNYVLTTEAHFLPLSIGDSPTDRDHLPRRVIIDPDELMSDTTKDRSKKQYRSACPTSTTEHHTSAELSNYGHTLRARIQIIMQELTRQTSNDEESETCPQPEERLRAWAFSPSNNEHLAQLKRMGVQLQIQADGRVQMIHSAATGGAGNGDDEKTMSCSLDPTPKNEQASFPVYFNASHAALSQVISLLMLVILLWLALVLLAALTVLFAALGYRKVRDDLDNKGLEEEKEYDQTGDEMEDELKDAEERGSLSDESAIEVATGIEKENAVLSLL
ncbi:hypothetical protein AB6A40_010631 [Gnathostoma spinigerum]|uniref:alpha-1,2-Mannosidase n=1 Tax=Gnathostoma spinigerum TaxID=75299 RepID=A0ABD6EXV0_9BILA